MNYFDEPHHDGSALYVRGERPQIGTTMTVVLRVPHASACDRVHVRSVVDGEPVYRKAVVASRDDVETWWECELPIMNSFVHYRFLLEGGSQPYRWVNAAGSWVHDVPDSHDFRMSTFDPPPPWLEQTILYLIMPDRFARSSSATNPRPEAPRPEWAITAEWTDSISSEWRDAVRQLFGGDLDGVREHLDHLTKLGVDAIYLTPFFPAPSSHRYNASTFDQVDPLLGGDAALAALMTSAHQLGMRVIGDLTTNHSGSGHVWFTAAQADTSAVETAFYWFDEHPDAYVAWFGIRSLPKFNLDSDELRERLVIGPESVIGRWLSPPYELDGWRIDVANMTGRYGERDLNHSVARDIRETMAGIRADLWLVAEHCHDATADLQGDGWQGTMAYNWFTRPVWCWLRGDDPPGLLGFPSPPPLLGGREVAASMRLLAAGVPWSAFVSSMTLLDSHDTARFRSVAADADRHVVGVAMLLTYPGVPTIFAGDEIGLEGRDGDQARKPFPWDEADWDHDLLEVFRQLIAVRRTSPALQVGGLRWLHAGDDSLTFVRESPEERMLVHLARSAHAPVIIAGATLGVGSTVGPIFGTEPLRCEAGTVTLPGGGPTAHIWRLPAAPATHHPRTPSTSTEMIA